MTKAKISNCLQCGRQYYYYEEVTPENRGYCPMCVLDKMKMDWNEIRSRVKDALLERKAVSKKSAAPIEVVKEVVGTCGERQMLKELCNKGMFAWTTKKSKKYIWFNGGGK